MQNGVYPRVKKEIWLIDFKIFTQNLCDKYKAEEGKKLNVISRTYLESSLSLVK